jgi:hypothetical protein
MGTILAVGKLLLLALLGAAQVQTDRGFATEFGGGGDPLSGGAMACTHKNMQPDDLVCAHRTLPCGTPILLQNLRTRRMAACVVADRGPYGATLPNGEIILKIRASEEGTWRGLIDVSPRVAEMLELSGRERVGLFFERAPRRRPQQVRWSMGQVRHPLLAWLD